MDKLANVCERLGVDNSSSVMLSCLKKGDVEQIRQVLSRKHEL